MNIRVPTGGSALSTAAVVATRDEAFRRLAELAGLEIGMCSIPGKGSLFWVETPLSLPPQ